MKIARVTTNDPIERLNIGIRQSTNRLIENYQAFYKKTYGDEIKAGQLVEEILRAFIETDKGFLKFKASLDAKATSKAANAKRDPSVAQDDGPASNEDGETTGFEDLAGYGEGEQGMSA